MAATELAVYLRSPLYSWVLEQQWLPMTPTAVAGWPLLVPGVCALCDTGDLLSWSPLNCIHGTSASESDRSWSNFAGSWLSASR